MDTSKIFKDLQENLKCLDKNNYVLNSIISHLEEQCEDAEIQIIEDEIYGLIVKKYNNREEFIEDYQPIFDSVDFPLMQCFEMMDKRTLDYSKL